jgi:hypothetical protein
VTEEEFKMCLKWKDLKGTDIWTCTACESANENLDKKVKEVNAKVEEIRKDLKVIGDKQEQSELREQVRDTKVEAQATELAAMKERMAMLELNSGTNILREVEERKSRGTNLVFYKIPEVDISETIEFRKKEGEKRVRMQKMQDHCWLDLTVSRPQTPSWREPTDFQSLLMQVSGRLQFSQT